MREMLNCIQKYAVLTGLTKIRGRKTQNAFKNGKWDYFKSVFLITKFKSIANTEKISETKYNQYSFYLKI